MIVRCISFFSSVCRGREVAERVGSVMRHNACAWLVVPHSSENAQSVRPNTIPVSVGKQTLECAGVKEVYGSPSSDTFQNKFIRPGLGYDEDEDVSNGKMAWPGGVPALHTAHRHLCPAKR